MATAEKKEIEKKPAKKKVRKNVPVGQAHIQANFGNVIVTITDPHSQLKWQRKTLAEKLRIQEFAL